MLGVIVQKTGELLSRTRIQVILIILATTLVYLNTLGNEFVWDDKTFVDWDLTRSFSNLPIILKGALPSPHEGDYRPVKGIILTIDYKFFGTNPFGYHIQAILIHLSATLLVYFLIKEFFKDSTNGGTRNVAFISALLFGVHPMQTEAITFITSSSDMLGISFLLLSFYFYVRGVSEYRNRKRRLLISLIFAVLAFVTYEITLVLPFLLFLYDFCFLRLGKKEFISRLRVYFLYFLSIFSYIFFRFGLLKVYGNNSYLEDDFYLTALAMVKVVLKYIQLLIFPQNLTINHEISKDLYALTYIDYKQEVIRGQSIFDVQVLLSIAAIFLSVFVAILLYKQSLRPFGLKRSLRSSETDDLKKLPIVTFCILWFFISLAPVSNLFPLNNLMAERYLYLASVGYCLGLGIFFSRALSNHPKSFFEKQLKIGSTLLLLALIGFFIKGTIMRNYEWRNSETFWSRELLKAPESVLAHHNLGITYNDSGQTEKALSELKIAAENNRRNIARVYLNLGSVYLENGEIESGVEQLNKVLSIEPANYKALQYLADAYKKVGKTNKAIEMYQKSLISNPYFYDSYINLGTTYAGQGKIDLAIEQFKKAKFLNSKFIPAYVNLAAVYAKEEKWDLAIVELEQALKIDPSNEEAREALERLKNSAKKSG